MGAYEDTLENIKKTLRKDKLSEIYLERARYLLSVDEMLEEMLSEKQGNVVLTTKTHEPAEAATEDAIK